MSYLCFEPGLAESDFTQATQRNKTNFSLITETGNNTFAFLPAYHVSLEVD